MGITRQSKMRNGFTLIEVMVVVAIIAILASIAYPSYTQYVIKTHRTEAMTEMSTIASKLNLWKLQNPEKGFSRSQMVDFYGPDTIGMFFFPKNSTIKDAYYHFILTASTKGGGVVNNSWELRAIAIRGQSSDGDIKIDDQGWRCWEQKVNDCQLSATSGWR